MAALLEGVIPTLPTEPGRQARVADPAGVSAGLAYVRRCLRTHRRFAIITGSAPGLELLVERVAMDCSAREDLHLVRISSPTDDAMAFRETALAQLGFELHQAGRRDLQNLLTVFLRHESARGRRTVAIIDATDHCGPHVLECMKALSTVRGGATPAMTFILTGSPGLHRVLDSRGMSGLSAVTRERFDLDWSQLSVGVPRTASDLVPSAQRSLLEMRNGKVVTRHAIGPGRLLIGRSKASDLRLVSAYVSRQHATLIVTPDEVTVIDLRSTNGTLVNGRVTPGQRLEQGDVLSIGNFRLRYDCRGG